jgi:hypothetical protein
MAAADSFKDIYRLDQMPFVTFTTSLVRDVYKVIIDSSIEQLQAYAAVVSDLTKPVAEYQEAITGIQFDATGGATAAANLPPLLDYVGSVLGLEVKDADKPTYTIATPTESQAPAIIEQLSDVSTSGTTPKTAKEVIVAGTPPNKTELLELVYNKLDQDTKKSRDLLVTILKIGMQKVVVTDGLIATKLVFHVDATDTQTRNSSEVEQHANSWGVSANASAKWGWGKANVSGGYQASNLSVKAVNERSMSAVNMSADIMGEVRINFRTDTFPTAEIGD